MKYSPSTCFHQPYKFVYHAATVFGRPVRVVGRVVVGVSHPFRFSVVWVPQSSGCNPLSALSHLYSQYKSSALTLISYQNRVLTVADDAVVSLWWARTAVVAAGDRFPPRQPVRWHSHVRTPREELLEPSTKPANKQTIHPIRTLFLWNIIIYSLR